jgi:hypothetical protein
MPESLIAAGIGLALIGALGSSGRLRFLFEEIPTWAAPHRGAGAAVGCARLVRDLSDDLARGDGGRRPRHALVPEHLSRPSGPDRLSACVVVARRPDAAAPVSCVSRRHHCRRALRDHDRVGRLGAGDRGERRVALVLLAIGYTPTAGEASGSSPLDVPAVLLWLAGLPAWRKLIVVAMAMTVEEAFFRAYLQTRIGWVPSSVLFALSHGGYGLPNLTASVFVVSLAIGWAFRRRDNLLPCIVAHGIFDGVQLFVIMPLAIKHLQSLA